MHNDAFGFTPLSSHPSLYDFLKELFSVSGQQLKNLLPGKRTFDVRARQTIWLPIELVNHRQVWPGFNGLSPSILSEDDSIVALHKPAGIHTHGLAYDPTPNLVSWLVSQGRFDLAKVNPTAWDRGCLYRLDEGTSGLVLYAKSDAVYQRVREQFATLVKRKMYLAIVEGVVEKAGNDQRDLAPFGPGGKQMRTQSGGQRADLSYRPLAQVAGGTLVLIELKTGLRHQIRAQMAALGHPLWGDELYSGRKAERMFLHCWRYELEGKAWVDSQAELFNNFFDLNGLLEVVLDELRVSERR